MKKRIITENIPNYGSSIIRTWETTNDFNQYDDSTKYIKSIENIPNGLLNEFPEYLDGWDFIITNTGLTCFYDKEDGPSKLVIYDMFDTSDIKLEDIKPDISMMLQYNFIDQPLNVRKINFRDGKFTPDLSYTYQQNETSKKYCYFINCDNLEESSCINNNLYFEFNGKQNNFNSIIFNYKPVFVFKIFNSDGTIKKDLDDVTEENKIMINVSGKNAIREKDNIYYIDLSDYEKNSKSSLKSPVYISLENCGSGYLEVI